ncbi:hypothetical protein POVWA2_037260 [Plasmodium ovale wallikeri]|uniref:Uncharacterized protein n=1 Tax=Plasmodium ovale wallikeri TaxID=864142 RepID=A0A1A8Z3Q4_PLAOA|nr:hypothetical protein POVWA1_038290 [Plasmodium ovale wallikeri]SBT39207.1 hypothetical protein POVWA2_037260 [Plasmodium ovale wallikeri]
MKWIIRTYAKAHLKVHVCRCTFAGARLHVHIYRCTFTGAHLQVHACKRVCGTRGGGCAKHAHAKCPNDPLNFVRKEKKKKKADVRTAETGAAE